MLLENLKKSIQNHHKNLSFGEFIETICSWYPLRMYNSQNGATIYPGNNRHAPIVSFDDFEEKRNMIPSKSIEKTDDFFSVFGELFRSISLPGFHHYYSVENAPYSNHISSSSNVYSSYHVTGDCDRVAYSLATKIHAKNIYNSTMAWMYSENIYQSLGIIRSSQIFFSRFIQDSHDIWFSSDLIGCIECLFCSNLQNTSYAIGNIIYSKEEYLIKKVELLKKKDLFDTYYLALSSRGHNVGSENTIGKYCNYSKDIVHGYYSIYVKNGKNILFTGHPDGLQDVYNSIFVSAGRGYYGACGVGGDSEEIYNCVSIMRSFECYYSYFLERCSFCFGCIGLKNKSYCILNKQYSKDEWYIKVGEIGEILQKNPEGLCFFPTSLCPFYFDDSLAAMMLPQRKNKNSDFLYSPSSTIEEQKKQVDVIPFSELSKYVDVHDGQYKVSDAIVGKVILGKDNKYFTIQNMELDFLERYELPIPQVHPMTRLMYNFGTK